MADLNEKTVDELYEVAAERDIDGRSSMDKEELISALEADGYTGDESGDDEPTSDGGGDGSQEQPPADVSPQAEVGTDTDAGTADARVPDPDAPEPADEELDNSGSKEDDEAVSIPGRGDPRSTAEDHAVPDPDAEVRAPEPEEPRDITSKQQTPQNPAPKTQYKGAKPKDRQAWTPQNPPSKAVLGITVQGEYEDEDEG